jgi:hypothetical protein
MHLEDSKKDLAIIIQVPQCISKEEWYTVQSSFGPYFFSNLVHLPGGHFLRSGPVPVTQVKWYVHCTLDDVQPSNNMKLGLAL